MPPSREERLTARFYEWELRGRGWDLWDQPVDLEPQFWPFFGHADTGAPTNDDGRKPTLMSQLAEGVADLLFPKDGSAGPEEDTPGEEAYQPIWIKDIPKVTELRLALPRDAHVQRANFDQFLLVSQPIAFEIIGTQESITTQFVCATEDAVKLRAQLEALLPGAHLTDCTGTLQNLWDASEGETAVVEFGLSSEFMCPLRRFDRFDPDPLAAVVSGMSRLGEGEVVLYQVLFRATINRWTESVLRAVTDGRGKSFFENDPSMPSRAGQKVSSPLFGVVVRAAAQSPDPERSQWLALGIAESLQVFSDPRSNELIPLEYSQDGLSWRDDLLLRLSRRSGMLLNADELASLAHPLSASVREPKLVRYVTKSKAIPQRFVGNSLVLGTNEHVGQSAVVTQSVSERLKHTYVIGASGTGKSTLLLNMVTQDMENGSGIALLDPHGDLVDAVLARVPKHRIEDVVLIDPSDEEYPVGFNILSAHSELERNLLESDLVSVFQRLSTSWGDQMTTVLGNAIVAFLESSRGGTLADLRRFLVEPEFRSDLLGTVDDADVLYYWRKEFALLRGKPQGPILTRLSTFLRPRLIRNMVTQREKCLDFSEIMNGKKILLAKLSQGLIGAENSYLLGTLLVSKLNQAATSRQQVAESERNPFFIYIDEFHNFVTPSMAAILAGARKYGLGLILAHQDLQQIAGRDSGLMAAVLSNPYTRICFRLGDFDAKKLETGFSTFEARDLQNLSVGSAICRIERAEYDFNLQTRLPETVDEERTRLRREEVISSSRGRYATKRNRVVRHLPASTSEPETRKRRTGEPSGAAPKNREVAVSSKRPTLEEASRKSGEGQGRGGKQHQYLQHLVKRWAEDHGYRATLEQPILKGLGAVDLALEKDGLTVACEVSISTSPEHELQNIQKCLAAGFDHVVVLSTKRATLDRIAQATVDLDPSEKERVRYFLPEELFEFLEVKAASQEEETQQTVRGYRVKISRSVVSEAEQHAKKRLIAGAVLKSIRHLKK